jgi:hypothetical protein
LGGSFHRLGTIFDANFGGVLLDTIDDIYCTSGIVVTFVDIYLLAVINQRNSLTVRAIALYPLPETMA